MNRLDSKRDNSFRRKNRTKVALRNNNGRPRLSVTISNRHISAQVIDDGTHKTIVSSTTVNQKASKASLTEQAIEIGKDISKKAQVKKIKKVTFDRGPKLYHGRIKALADSAREEGLEF